MWLLRAGQACQGAVDGGLEHGAEAQVRPELPGVVGAGHVAHGRNAGVGLLEVLLHQFPLVVHRETDVVVDVEVRQGVGVQVGPCQDGVHQTVAQQEPVGQDAVAAAELVEIVRHVVPDPLAVVADLHPPQPLPAPKVVGLHVGGPVTAAAPGLAHVVAAEAHPDALPLGEGPPGDEAVRSPAVEVVGVVRPVVVLPPVHQPVVVEVVAEVEGLIVVGENPVASAVPDVVPLAVVVDVEAGEDAEAQSRSRRGSQVEGGEVSLLLPAVGPLVAVVVVVHQLEGGHHVLPGVLHEGREARGEGRGHVHVLEAHVPGPHLPVEIDEPGVLGGGQALPLAGGELEVGPVAGELAPGLEAEEAGLKVHAEEDHAGGKAVAEGDPPHVAVVPDVVGRALHRVPVPPLHVRPDPAQGAGHVDHVVPCGEGPEADLLRPGGHLEPVDEDVCTLGLQEGHPLMGHLHAFLEEQATAGEVAEPAPAVIALADHLLHLVALDQPRGPVRPPQVDLARSQADLPVRLPHEDGH